MSEVKSLKELEIICLLQSSSLILNFAWNLDLTKASSFSTRNKSSLFTRDFLYPWSLVTRYAILIIPRPIFVPIPVCFYCYKSKGLLLHFCKADHSREGATKLVVDPVGKVINFHLEPSTRPLAMQSIRVESDFQWEGKNGKFSNCLGPSSIWPSSFFPLLFAWFISSRYNNEPICHSHFQIEETLDKADLQLHIELWYTENGFGISQQSAIECVSARVLSLAFQPTRGLHYHLPVLFDYFHLSAVSVTIHAILSSIHQPYIKYV